MNVLVIDIGGTHVKILTTGQKEPCESRWTGLIAKLLRPRRKPVETPKKNP